MALARFLTVGIEEDERRVIGDLPHGRGVLGELITHPRILRLADVSRHPRSYGFPPRAPHDEDVPRRSDRDPRRDLRQHLPDREGRRRGVRRGRRGAAVRPGRVRRHRHPPRPPARPSREPPRRARADGRGAGRDQRDLAGAGGRGRPRPDPRAGGQARPGAGGGEGAGDPAARPRRSARRPRAPASCPTTWSARRSASRRWRPASWTRERCSASTTSTARRFEAPGLGPLGLEAESGLYVPLAFRGRSLGMLVALDRLTGGPHFSAADEQLLTSFATAPRPRWAPHRP